MALDAVGPCVFAIPAGVTALETFYETIIVENEKATLYKDSRVDLAPIHLYKV